MHHVATGDAEKAMQIPEIACASCFVSKKSLIQRRVHLLLIR